MAPYPRRWWAVAAVGLAMFISALDATIVALGLPAIASGFRLTDSVASGVILAYAIPLSILILPAGGWTARYRPFPLFAVAVAGFGIGSLVCAYSGGFATLIAGRVIQGSFAAVLSTQGFALAAGIVPPNERGRAIGLVGSLAPMGGVAGPGIGGVLIGEFGWPSIFLVNVPVVLVAIALALYALRPLPAPQGRAGGTPAAISELLRIPRFRTALLAFLASVAMASGLYYLLPFDLTGLQRLAPSAAGVALLAMPLGMGLVGLLAGYLTDRYGRREFVLGGLGLALVGLAALGSVALAPGHEALLAGALLVVGAGIGLFTTPNQTTLMSLGPRGAMGAASALANLSARLGSVVGPLVIAMAWSSGGGLGRQVPLGLAIVAGIALIALAFAIRSVWGSSASPSGDAGAPSAPSALSS